MVYPKTKRHIMDELFEYDEEGLDVVDFMEQAEEQIEYDEDFDFE